MKKSIDPKPEKYPEHLNTGLIYSLAAHLGVLAFIVLRIVIFPSEPLEQQRSIRVDIVGLPDRISGSPPPSPAPQPAPPRPEPKQPPPQPKAPEPKAPAPKAPEPKAPAPAKAKATPKLQETQRQALERLEAAERARRESRSGPIVETRQDEPEYRGNVLSPGSSLTGVDQLQHEGYLEQVEAHVQQHWEIPQWLNEAGFRARVNVHLDRRGFVTKIAFVERSDNAIFNQKVVEAIQAASPFPEPPRKFEAILSVQGMELRFPQ